MKKYLIAMAALVCCMIVTALLTACTENEDNPIPGRDSSIVGNWYSDVSGSTFAKWNYGKTWQTTEFRKDNTGTTRIFYTIDDIAVGCEKYEFTFSASSEGVLTMTPEGRDVVTAKWKVTGNQLSLSDGNGSGTTFMKNTSDMTAKFDKWAQTKEMIDVPQPAKYTVFVYGNAGGYMDIVIETGLWEKVQKYLKDPNNVRVICMYKYGKDLPEEDKAFTGKYAKPGDIVWFELNDQTDLNKIKDEGMQAYGMGEEAKKLKICNPNTMRMFLEFSSLACPAEDYVLAIWGHGSGFDPLKDVPGKYPINEVSSTRGVMTDEWVDDEWMDMYEMYDALNAAGIDRLKTLMFHNCFMGNIESLTQARSFADYIFASAHVLSSDGKLMTEFIRGLMETGDPEKAGELMFERSTPDWQNGYSQNGDYKMIRTDKFEAIIDAAKQLCDRILALYPTKKEAIDKATSQVYRFEAITGPEEFKYEFMYPFFDIANYAQLLAKETDDAELKTISEAMDKAFKEAFVHYCDVNNNVQHLDHYTLSVCLMRHKFYVADYVTNVPDLKPLNNFNVGYELCDFHKLTGWGNWLNTNEQALDKNPQNGGGGPLE